MSRKLLLFLILLIITITVLLGFSLFNKSDQLKAMERVSSNIQLQTAQEVKRSKQDKGTTLGKPVYPHLILEYEPKSNYTERDVLDEVIGIFEKNDWGKEEVSLPPPHYMASLPQDGFIIKASISIQSDRDIVSILLRTFPR